MTEIAWNDERWERREAELEKRRNRVGAQIASCRRPFLRLFPRIRRQRALLQEQLVWTLGALAEVRELRRALLGLKHNSHIRGRALPNFVANNPGYAEVVADEVEEARLVVENFANGVPQHE